MGSLWKKDTLPQKQQGTKKVIISLLFCTKPAVLGNEKSSKTKQQPFLGQGFLEQNSQGPLFQKWFPVVLKESRNPPD